MTDSARPSVLGSNTGPWDSAENRKHIHTLLDAHAPDGVILPHGIDSNADHRPKGSSRGNRFSQKTGFFPWSKQPVQ